MGPVGRTAIRYGYKRVAAGKHVKRNEHWPNQTIKIKADGSWKHISSFEKTKIVGEGKGADALDYRLTLWHERH